ncbi:tetratricopeptide repeat protein [Erythrobacter sp. AP23]|uniref:tetratricopeptide repeat protein n=1 Tax=Erythrobacter sp. AP23 TaxID=499656 RepID=UPI00076DBD25|nr:tetratricopeptide repeat protein [Erythrobacter sp. AP23]KWV94682.1 cytochrome C biogenesis protein CycH [Erythrobacter sp. AP23]
MSEERSGSRTKTGVLLLGLALAAVLGAVGYRSLDRQDGAAPPTAGADPLATLEARVEDDPRDAATWQELGYARFDRGDFGAAATAYRRAIEIDPDEAVLWSALGEALVMDSERDPLPANARAAFRHAVSLDPADPRARYFLAVERDLDGDHEGAIAAWLDLLEDTPRGAPWEADLVRTIEQVGRINSIDVAERIARAQAARGAQVAFAGGGAATAAIPGPSAAQIAAASAMPPGEQRQMAEGMVARLEAKLAADPANVDGWIMLMRSRMTLGQPDRARRALADATRANPAAAVQLREAAEALGIR